MICRFAQMEDLTQMLDIYNYEVAHGTATFDTWQKTPDEWKEWYDIHDRDTHPVFVAESENQVLGYASLSPYRTKDAFATTVELSLYVDVRYRGQGVATLLMDTILKYAREHRGIHAVVSVITSGNHASTKLHEKYGFTYCGTLREVGVKFGEMRGIDHYEWIV